MTEKNNVLIIVFPRKNSRSWGYTAFFTICYLWLFNKTRSGVHSVLRQTQVHPLGNFPGSGTGPGELRGFFQWKCVSIVFHFQVDVWKGILTSCVFLWCLDVWLKLPTSDEKKMFYQQGSSLLGWPRITYLCLKLGRFLPSPEPFERLFRNSCTFMVMFMERSWHFMGSNGILNGFSMGCSEILWYILGI